MNTTAINCEKIIDVDLENKVITITESFMLDTLNIGSPDFFLMRDVLRRHPGFQLAITDYIE